MKRSFSLVVYRSPNKYSGCKGLYRWGEGGGGVVGGGWGEDYCLPTTFLDPLNNLFPRVLCLASRKNPGVNLIKLLQV